MALILEPLWRRNVYIICLYGKAYEVENAISVLSRLFSRQICFAASVFGHGGFGFFDARKSRFRNPKK